MAPPVPLEQVLSYRTHLKDAITGGAVTDASTLVTLHRPNIDTHVDRLLVNLTKQCKPGKICSLITNGGDVFPPGQAIAGYRVLVTFVKLLTAPAIRIICEWEMSVKASPRTTKHLEVALDFHFNSTEGGLQGIEQLELRKDVPHEDGRMYDELCFKSNGCTVAKGLTLALQNEDTGPYGQALVSYLHSLLNSTSMIRLRFSTAFDDDASALPDVWPYIIGDGVDKLRSLSMPEWSAMPLQPKRNMPDLLDGPNPFPWILHDCSNTFSTIKEASVELYESARLTSLEAEEILRDWSTVSHLGLLYKIGGIVVLAVRNSPVLPNSPIRVLGGDAPHGQLPDKLLVSFGLKRSDGEHILGVMAERCAIPIRFPMHHDMLFVISNVTDSIRAASVPPIEANFGDWCEVKFKPCDSPLALQRQLETAVNLGQSVQWHPLVLNQRHQLPAVDLAAASPLEKEDIEEAFRKVLQMADFNQEQLQALHSVREAVGGCALVSGPAGTGKTLIIQAICLFLHTIGLHVLVLAPANSNVTDFVKRFTSSFKDITATRVFPSSADKDFQKTADGVARVRHLEQPDTSLDEFEMVRAMVQSNDKNALYEDYGLPAQVLRSAREGRFSLMKSFRGVTFDVWAKLKEHVDASDAGNSGGHDGRDVYQFAYDEAKAHYMAVATRLCITTTGNVKAPVIRDNFAQDKHNVKCHGLVVLVDEACKDREIDTLSALVLPEWRSKLVGAVLLGDERQLEPTNTSAKGVISFNPFRERITLPMFTRLQREGFPTITHLVEQHRMSSKISKFPHDNFYPIGTMRDAAGMDESLQNKLPGLTAVLRDILVSLPRTRTSPLLDIGNDAVVRDHYLQVKGKRDKSKRSPFVREHVRVFFDKIYWYLRAYFMEAMEENVMVICAYKGARNMWMDVRQHFQRTFRIPTSQLPKILTVDSSQGCEALFTILDCSVQNYDPEHLRRDIGFIHSDRRMNVALTRAREVRWCIGGSCNPDSSKPQAHSPIMMRYNEEEDGDALPPAYVRYKEETAAKGSVTIVKQRELGLNMDWLDYLPDRRGEVVVGRTFAQDMQDTAR